MDGRQPNPAVSSSTHSKYILNAYINIKFIIKSNQKIFPNNFQSHISLPYCTHEQAHNNANENRCNADIKLFFKTKAHLQ